MGRFPKTGIKYASNVCPPDKAKLNPSIMNFCLRSPEATPVGIGSCVWGNESTNEDLLEDIGVDIFSCSLGRSCTVSISSSSESVRSNLGVCKSRIR